MYSCIVWLVTIIAAPRGLEGFVEGDSELDVVNVAPEEVDDGLRFAGVLELGRLSLLGVAKLVLPQAAEGISVLAGVQRARQRSH